MSHLFNNAVVLYSHLKLVNYEKVHRYFQSFINVLLFSFSKKNTYIDYRIIKAPVCTSCATATNLGAVKNGTQVTLSWNLDPTNVNSCSYGGYYNCSSCSPSGGSDVVNFGSTTSSWPLSISVASSAYSIHYSVTVNCSDGSHTYSNPYYGPL